MGILAIRKGHQYYRRSVYKKTLIEDVLGLATPISQYSSPDANLTIGTTSGQASRTAILFQTDQYLSTGFLRRGRIVFYVAFFLGLLALTNLSGVVTAVGLYLIGRHPYIPWP